MQGDQGNLRSGIYFITFEDSDKEYIGKSLNVIARIRQHLHSLAKGNHHCKELQKDFNTMAHNGVSFRYELMQADQIDSFESWIIGKRNRHELYNSMIPK